MTEIALANGSRPKAITIICVVGVIGALLSFPIIFSDLAWQVGAWYPPYLGLTMLVGLVCIVGLWMMKKWGMYGYIGLTVVNQVVLLLMGSWNIMVLLVPGIVIYFAYKHLPDMS